MPSNQNTRFMGKRLLLLLLFLILTCLFAVTLGPSQISIIDTCKIILSKIPFYKNIFGDLAINANQQTIILQIRLPRIILAALVGTGLAAVGAAFQGLLKNPMADPYIIGISSGSALGAAIAIISGLTMISFLIVPFFAFLGALLSTFIVFNLARVGNKVPIFNLLLSGVALSSFMSAIMSLLMILNSHEMSQVIFWLLGSFSTKSWNHVQIAFPLISLGLIGLYFFARDLNILLFGEDTALHLGIDVEKIKKIIVIIGSFTIAAAVSVSGTIGFVGLIIPHSVRLITGPDHRILLPASALAGGIFMVITDTLARTLLGSVEIPVGIITALFGGPFFIYLLKKNNQTAS